MTYPPIIRTTAYLVLPAPAALAVLGGAYRPSIEDLEKPSRFFGVSLLATFPKEEEQTLDNNVFALPRAAKQLKPEDVDELRRHAEFRKARIMYEKGKRPDPDRERK